MNDLRQAQRELLDKARAWVEAQEADQVDGMILATDELYAAIEAYRAALTQPDLLELVVEAAFAFGDLLHLGVHSKYHDYVAARQKFADAVAAYRQQYPQEVADAVSPAAQEEPNDAQ